MVSKLEESKDLPKEKQQIGSLSESELKKLAAFCFDTLIAQVDDTVKKAPKFNLENAECALFVTWTKGKTSELRGCIGTFEPEKLSKILGEYATLAAFDDDRFD